MVEANSRKLLGEFIPETINKQFVIPVYQRKYTWTVKKQLKKLMSDLVILIEDNTLEKKHFLGTIVFLENVVNYRTEKSIVDGQQRLVTMFLIANAMKTVATEEVQKREIDNSYLFNISAEKDSKYYQRMYPAVADSDDYLAISQGKFADVKDNKSNITKNFSYLCTELQKLVNRYSYDKVLYALKRFTIVYIQLDKHDNAQQIFESINSTGERLTASDLIRNFIMMNKSNEEQTKLYENYWQKLEQIFDNSKGKKLEDFFRYYLAAANHSYAEASNIYQVFKDYWNLKRVSTSEEEILNKLVRYAKHYSELYYQKPQGKYAHIINDFQKMGGVVLAPLVMELAEWAHYDHKISEEQFYSVISILNVYQVRRTFNGDESGKVSKAFPGYLKMIDKYAQKFGFNKLEDIVKYSLVTRNQSNVMALPTDKSLRANMLLQNAYGMKATRWLLNKIENSGNHAPVSLDKLSIEHIMPQTANDYWIKRAGASGEDYTDLVNRIGNLTLVAKKDNSAAGNRNFETKKKIFKETAHLKINEELYQRDQWDVESIEERGNKIVDKLIQLYPYQYSEQSYEQDDERNVFLEKDGIKAKGNLSKDEILTIFAGSYVNQNAKNVAADHLESKRQELVTDGIIAEDNSGLYFTTDYIASSISNGTELILGGSKNGWEYWKDVNGIAVNDSLRNKQ